MSKSERWKPSVTVAAVVERDGRYLLVEEQTREGLRLNNPAGHLDPGESLLEAVKREVLEETGSRFEPETLVGIYLSRFRRTDGEEVGLTAVVEVIELRGAEALVLRIARDHARAAVRVIDAGDAARRVRHGARRRGDLESLRRGPGR